MYMLIDKKYMYTKKSIIETIIIKFITQGCDNSLGCNLKNIEVVNKY